MVDSGGKIIELESYHKFDEIWDFLTSEQKDFLNNERCKTEDRVDGNKYRAIHIPKKELVSVSIDCFANDIVVEVEEGCYFEKIKAAVMEKLGKAKFQDFHVEKIK